MVNFMFGANAPKLTKLIIDELKKEKEAREGKRERFSKSINELAEEERERYEVIENQEKAAREKEKAKAEKDLYERRLAEANNILENLAHFGVILIFPHARTAYHDAFGDLLGEAGLTISQTEKIIVEEQQLEELFYFTQNPFPEEAIEELLADTSHILLVKPIPARDVTEPTDDIVLEIVYGKSRKPPGDENSPAKILEKFEVQVEDEEEPKAMERVGIWVPISDLEKATALRLFYHRQTESYLIPEPEPEPPHYAVVFEAFRRHELEDLMERYEDDILRYGFFTSEVPEEAKIIAKNGKQYEKQLVKTPPESHKLVLQLSKKRSECILAFVSAKPAYISPNASEGKRECSIFFPDDYDVPVPGEEESETTSDGRLGSTKEPEGSLDETDLKRLKADLPSGVEPIENPDDIPQPPTPPENEPPDFDNIKKQDVAEEGSLGNQPLEGERLEKADVQDIQPEPQANDPPNSDEVKNKEKGELELGNESDKPADVPNDQ